MDNSSRRDIILNANPLDEAIHRELVAEIQSDIREGRYDSNVRLKREWFRVADEEMDCIEKTGRSFILMGVLAAVLSLGMLGLLGKWLLGLAFGAVMLAAVLAFHRHLSRLAMRIGRAQHRVSDLLSYGEPVEGQWGGEAEGKLAEYAKLQKILTIPQMDAMDSYAEDEG